MSCWNKRRGFLIFTVETSMQRQGNAQHVYLGGKKQQKSDCSRQLNSLVLRMSTIELIRRHGVFHSCGNMFQTEPGALPRQLSFAVGQINGSASLARSVYLRELVSLETRLDKLS